MKTRFHIQHALLILFSALVPILCSYGQHNSHEPFAVLYTETNYGGWSYRVLPGDEISDFSRLDDGRWAFLDREIRSVEIRGTLTLKLWDSSSFQGNFINLNTSVPNLNRINNGSRTHGPSNWDMRIQSIEALSSSGHPGNSGHGGNRSGSWPRNPASGDVVFSLTKTTEVKRFILMDEHRCRI